MTRSPLRALLGVLLAVGVAGAVLTAPGSAGAATPTGILPERPEVGSCHALTYAEFLADADPDPAVACHSRHTSRTFVVRDAPADVDLTNFPDVARFSDQACTPAFRRTVSTNTKRRHMSGYAGYAVFVPTESEQRLGARWVRCDVVLFGGRAALAPLPTVVRVPALRSATPPDNEARCYTGKRLYITVCTRPHTYRAKLVFGMKGKAYPSQRSFERAASRRCTRASDARRWVWFKPSRADWRTGNRYVTCVDVTRR